MAAAAAIALKQLDDQPDALAKVYANSLFSLAESQGGQEKIEEVNSELEQIMEMTRSDAGFVEFLRSAILPMEQRRDSLRKIFEGRITDLLLRFLLVLNHKERLAHIGAIAAAYDEIVQDRFGRIEVDVFTATPITQDQLTSIGDRLRGAIGREPVLHAYTQPEMIGGLKLLIGDQMVDASVATRLRKLRERFETHGTAEVRSIAERMIDEGV